MRQLTASEVEFSIDVESEDLEVRGNASAWGEPEDTEYANEIIARLEAGDDAAWCVVVVRATWTYEVNGKDCTIEGSAALGGCCLTEKMECGSVVAKAAEETARYHGMYEDALDDLNRSLAAIVNDAKEIERQLNETKGA